MNTTISHIENHVKSLTLHKGIHISFYTYLGFLVFYLLYSIEKFYPLIITIAIFELAHLFMFYVLKKGYYRLARNLYVILSIVFLLIFTFFIMGSETRIHYYLIPYSVLAFSMAEPKRLWTTFIYISINLFFFAAAEFNIIPHITLVDYPMGFLKLFRMLNTILSLILCFYVGYLFFQIDLEKQKRIIKQNNELRSINKQLKQSQTEISHQNKKALELNHQLHKNLDLIQLQKKELERANETKGKLLSIIAHDIRNPLSAIISLSDVLSIDIDDYSTKELKTYIDAINDSANRINILLVNILSWANSQNGTILPNKCHFAIQELIENNQKLFLHNLNEKNISLNISSPDQDIPLVFADKDMMDTVIRNFLSNAIKFTHDGGQIKIKTAIKRSYLVLSIEDTGVGMEADKLKNLFRLGKNSSMKGTNNEYGMGIGLLICKEFIDLNQCQLFASSRKGIGSNFSIFFPLLTENT